MSVWGVIPARYAAVRLPGKPLVPVAGKPLVLHVLENARRAAALDRVIVATDDARVASVVRQAGGEAVLTDPAIPSGTDRIRAAVRILGGSPDRIVNIQGDEPLLSHEAIDAAVAALDEAEISTLAAPIADEAVFRNPNAVKVVLADDGTALYFSRAPIPFPRDGTTPRALQHVGLYAFHRAALEKFASLPPSEIERVESLEQLRWLAAGARIRVALIPEATIAVDTPEDVVLVEKALAARAIA